jgi:hypothetical protein
MWSAVRRILSDNVLHHVLLSCENEVIIRNVHLFMLDQFQLVRKNRTLIVGLTKALKTRDVIRSGMRVELRESFREI